MSPELQRILSEAQAVAEGYNRAIQVRAIEPPGGGVILDLVLPDGYVEGWADLEPVRGRLAQIPGVTGVFVETARRE